jgi:hypothetical protein
MFKLYFVGLMYPSRASMLLIVHFSRYKLEKWATLRYVSFIMRIYAHISLWYFRFCL